MNALNSVVVYPNSVTTQITVWTWHFMQAITTQVTFAPPTQHLYTESSISKPPAVSLTIPASNGTRHQLSAVQMLSTCPAFTNKCWTLSVPSYQCFIVMHLVIIGAVSLATDSVIKYRPVSHLAAKRVRLLNLVLCQVPFTSEWPCVIASDIYLSWHILMFCRARPFKMQSIRTVAFSVT